MATLTKAEAARQLGISRTTLYKLIDQGMLSATPDGLIDTAELVRVMSTVNVHRERPPTPLDRAPLDAVISGGEHRERPERTSSEHHQWTSSERQLTSSPGESERQLMSTYRDLVDILREQLQAAKEREQAYQEHIAHLTTMLDQAHQQNQRLLDLPRSPPQTPQEAPGATQAPRQPPRPPRPPQGQPGASVAGARGEMRRRIVALLQEHPDGLTTSEIRERLGVERSIADTLLGMWRYGLVQRVERGRYVVPAQALGRHA